MNEQDNDLELPDHKDTMNLVFLPVFLLAVILIAGYRWALIDDSYITFVCARQLVEAGHWGLINGLPANSATSPLNVFLLAFGFLAWPDPWMALVTAGLLMLMSAWALFQLSRNLLDSDQLGRIGSMVIVSNPLLLSTLGMESLLSLCLLLYCLVAYFNKNAILLGVFCGLSILSRPDSGLLLPFFAVALWDIRKASMMMGIAAAVAGPWHLWSWWQLGGLMPDTLVLKTEES